MQDKTAGHKSKRFKMGLSIAISSVLVGFAALVPVANRSLNGIDGEGSHLEVDVVNVGVEPDVVEEYDVSTAEFASKRLLVKTNVEEASESDVADESHVMVVEYNDVAEAIDAYQAYSSDSKVEFVASDILVSVASDEDGHNGGWKLESEDDVSPFESQELVDEFRMGNESAPVGDIEAIGAVVDKNGNEDPSTSTEGDSNHIPIVALIDTGAPIDDHVIERYSVLDSDRVDDDHGHGTNMMNTMIQENPDVRIVSIKAMDENGRGSVSSLYAAIERAVELDVDVINLSVSGYASQENMALVSAIDDAVSNGIVVVGAAGNHGIDAKYTVPGGIDSVYVVGACDNGGGATPVQQLRRHR